MRRFLMVVGVIVVLGAGILAGIAVTGVSGSDAAATPPKGTTTATGPLPSTPPTTVTPPPTTVTPPPTTVTQPPKQRCSRRHGHKKKYKQRCRPYDRDHYLTGGL